MKKLVLLVGLVFVFFAPVAMAIDPIGPGTIPEAGRWRAGAEYGYGLQDLKADNYNDWWLNTDLRMNKFKTINIHGVLARDVTDYLTVFVRVGANKGRIKSVESGSNWLAKLDDGDYGFSGGGGIRCIFRASENFIWAGVVQVMYHNIDLEGQTFTDYDCFNCDISGEMNLYTAQVATTFTVKANDHLSIYGGPFLNFAGGEVKLRTDIGGFRVNESLDVAERSNIGFVVGLLAFLPDGSTITVEYQDLLSGGQGVACSAVFPIN